MKWLVFPHVSIRPVHSVCECVCVCVCIQVREDADEVNGMIALLQALSLGVMGASVNYFCHTHMHGQ